MKLHGILVSVCVSLCALSVGCGGTSEEQVPVQGPSEVTPSAEQSPGAVTEDGQVQQEGDMHQNARNCKVTCTAVKIDSGATCSTVFGSGSTTFLGGCKKACRFAMDRAEESATGAGCRLTGCSESCN